MEQREILTGQRTATKEEVRSVAEEIAKRFDPEKIILFGSYAWGKPDPESDVDLLVIVNTSGSDWDVSVEIATAIRHPFPMDILVRSSREVAERVKQGDFFLKRVMETGEVLYERPRR
jgi:predicted nucleotidyltransferase